MHRTAPAGSAQALKHLPVPDAPLVLKARFEGCQALIGRITKAGGQAQMLAPPELATLRGNSHMIMQDKNNLQVADLVLKWIGESVSRPKAAK